MTDKISKLLANHTALPVLFVGSGLTRRYLNSPDWEGLLKKYCVRPFEYYNDKATRLCRDDPAMRLPTAADLIEEDFNEQWYTLDKYADSRAKHKAEMESKISPFKICIAECFCETSNNVLDQYADETALLKQIGNRNISCVITTNYDCFLEHCFGAGQFTPYIGQNDLLFSTTLEVGELYKIHGCCTKPESIIINSDDYAKFAKKSAYLSSKILTMFLERPIIFLGYGINDWDISRILDSIAECLEDDQLSQLAERLIFVERNSDSEKPDEISERRITTQSGKTICMKNILLTDYSHLYKAILNNKAKYDIKVLRKIKSQLYDLVQENKPSQKLYVATNIEDETQDIDFVVGVGVYAKFGCVGYRGIKAEELYLYAIGKSDLKYDDNMILREAISSLKNGRTIFPIRQFVSRCEFVDCLNSDVMEQISKSPNDLICTNDKDYIQSKGYINIPSIGRYYSSHNLSKTISNIFKSDLSRISSEDLMDFILTALEKESNLLSADGKGHPCRSNFKKCITLWDMLVYSDTAKQRIAELRKQ